MRYFLVFLCFLFQVFTCFAQASTPLLESSASLLDEEPIAEQGLFTGRKGLGDYQKTNIGKFRLISCSGGIPKNHSLFLMVEGLLDDGWVLEKPTILPSDNKEILKEEILYPISSLSDRKFTGYKTEVYFPLIYFLKKGTQEFNLNKKFSIKACKESACLEEMLDLSLSLKNDSKYPTDICSKMMRQFQLAVRTPQNKEVDVSWNVIDKNHAQLIATFNQDVSFLNLQSQELDDFEVIQKDFKDNQAALLIKMDTAKIPDSFLITLISSAGIFETGVSPQKGSYIFLSEELNWLNAVISGILLFFLSPLFYLFLSLPDQKESLVKNIGLIKKSFAFLFSCLAILFYFYPECIAFFEAYGIFIVISFLTLAWLLYRPKFNIGMAILLFFLLPKPYLNETLVSFSSVKGYIFILFAIWFFIALLPFEIFKKYPALFGALRKLKQYPVLIRVPQIVLLIWLIVSVFGNISIKINPETIDSLRKENQPMYLSVERGLCLSCFLNELSFSYYLKHFTSYKENEILFLRLDATQEHSKKFLKENKLALKTQGLLFGKNQVYPERIKGLIPIEEWYSLLKKVMPQEKENLPSLFDNE